MKFITPITIISVLLLFSCSSPSGAEQEQPQSKEDAEKTPNNVEEVVTDAIIEFNNSVVSHTDMAVVQLAQLMELDQKDVSASEIMKAAEEVKTDITSRIEELNHIEVAGNGGQEFLSAAIDHLTIVSRLSDIYITFADNLSIPDSLWDEEMGKAWLNNAEPVFLEFEDSYTLLEMAQGNFSALNDKDLIPAFDKSLEELQEEI